MFADHICYPQINGKIYIRVLGKIEAKALNFRKSLKTNILRKHPKILLIYTIIIDMLMIY